MSKEDEAIPENLIYNALGYKAFDNPTPNIIGKDQTEVIDGLVSLGIPVDIVNYLCTRTGMSYEQLGKMVSDLEEERNEIDS